MTILVTGNAGFIGFHTAKKLLERGDSVVGIDNLNKYYDVNLKKSRLKILEKIALKNKAKYKFIKGDLANENVLKKSFAKYKFERIIHLAAQAGVRYSLSNPHTYIRSNVLGFINILELCRHKNIKHLTYASTSSVYGANTQVPFKEKSLTDHPLQLYAATKKANELMAHSYSHLYKIPTSGLRFFTVYGPWGRPDMALFLFTKNILRNKPINLFNKGNHSRDFTYIDDIVESIIKVSDKTAKPNKKWNSNLPDISSSNAPYRVFNIGNNNPVKLLDYVEAIEKILNKKAKRKKLPLQPGDIPHTYADNSKLYKYINFKPKTDIFSGVKKFIDWYRDYYNE